MRKAAIDFDILLYEIGFAAESYWTKLYQDKGENTDLSPPWRIVERQLEERVAHILALAEADDNPIMCYTGKNNFRNQVAVSQPYKARAGRKPYHHKNILVYAQTRWDTRMEDGLEADDLLSMLITEDKNIICCSRDKDLLQTPGWHLQWEMGNQPMFGPFLVEGYGELVWNAEKGKLKGWGPKFFLAQMIMGDPVDSIPGLPRKGPSAAFKALEHTTYYVEGFKVVQSLYELAGYGLEYLTEQGQLLWMIKQKGKDGKPVMWKPFT